MKGEKTRRNFEEKIDSFNEGCRKWDQKFGVWFGEMKSEVKPNKVL